MVSSMLLSNKTAIITGAGRGIGRAISLSLAKEGANIVAVDVQNLDDSASHYQTPNIDGHNAALELVDLIHSFGGRAIAVNADVTKSNEVEQAIQATLREFGTIDILVNNAGVITYANVVDLTESQWDLVMNVNAKGVFVCCKLAAPHMMKNRSGKIVNISSESGKTGEVGLAHYCASKFAVIGFTQSLALELAPFNINVNAVCPGMVDTKMWQYLTQVGDPKPHTDNRFNQLVKQTMPLGRPQSPEDIARAVLFLCLSDNITGESINVTGGHEMH